MRGFARRIRHPGFGWAILTLAVAIVPAYFARFSVEDVQFIVSSRAYSLMQYVACAPGENLLLPRASLLSEAGETAFPEVSTLTIEPGVSVYYRRSDQGVLIELRKGNGVQEIAAWAMEPANSATIARMKTYTAAGDAMEVEVPASGGTITIAAEDAEFAIPGEGILEIGGLSGQIGPEIRLSSNAAISAVDTPLFGKERIEFVKEAIEPFSIIYTHPELLRLDERESGGMARDYAVFDEETCSAQSDGNAQPLASFAIVSRSDQPFEVGALRRTDAIGLATLGEVVKTHGPPKLVQVSTWSRVVSSPALQAAAAALIGFVSLVPLAGWIAQKAKTKARGPGGIGRRSTKNEAG